MSLKFKILDERNTGTVVEVDDFRFFSGEDRTIRMQIIHEYDTLPHYIAVGGTIELTLPGSTADIIKAGTIDSIDRSIVTVALSQSNTTDMTSGNLLGETTEGIIKRTVKSSNIIKKLVKTTD